MIIQIYAFTKVDQAVRAAELGVNQVGFVAGKYDLVPAELSFLEARQLRDALPSQTKAVALTMSTELDEVLRMVDLVEPDIVHISTDVDDVPVLMMEKLKKHLEPDIQLMKAIPVDGKMSIDLIQQFMHTSDIFLLDTKISHMPGVGATGHVHDWEISKKIVEMSSIPVILAGGLSAKNVGAAINQVQPWGVDSNTHTNIHGDNVQKDMQRIEAFVKAVRKIDMG